jgi:cytochrome c nitrite reductase small subunit
MNKKLQWLIPPLPWRLPVAILLGIFFGLGILVLYLSKAGSYLSDDPKACVNCHVMNPQYANWAHDAHSRVTTCNDCHVPQTDFFNKYFFKAKDGLKHAYAFTFRLEPQVIIMEKETRPMIGGNCIRCHTETVQKEFLKPVLPLYHNHLEERYCLDCHRFIPHGSVGGLASTPNALIHPKKRNTVAGWIKETNIAISNE